MTPEDSRPIVREENQASEARILAAMFRVIADSEARSQDARWTAPRILTNDAQSRVDDIRDQVHAGFETIRAQQEETGKILAGILPTGPPAH